MARVGTAGWSIPRAVADRFPTDGSGLSRYAARFKAVEINSTFYKPHRPATFERWASAVPEGFRFAVKAPKAVTHERRLVNASEPLTCFLDETAALGEKRGPVLIQLPPSLKFDDEVAGRFFSDFRRLFDGPAALEPRHATWFTDEAERLLTEVQVARVAADPAVVPEAAEPGGWPSLTYHRLHGNPRKYVTPYADEQLDALEASIASRTVPAWCIFDNTMSGAAAANALDLAARLSRPALS